MTSNDNLRDLVTGSFGFSVGIVLGAYLAATSPRKIPSPPSVQKGYVNPSSLELRCEDQDQDGNLETILCVNKGSPRGEERYLMKEDAGGMLSLVRYRVERPKILESE